MLTDAEVEAAIEEARQRMKAEVARNKNFKMMLDDIRPMVEQGQLWMDMNAAQRRLARAFIKEVERELRSALEAA